MPSGARYSTSISARRWSSSMINSRCSATSCPSRLGKVPQKLGEPKCCADTLTNIETNRRDQPVESNRISAPRLRPESELAARRRRPSKQARVQARLPVETVGAPRPLEARPQQLREWSCAPLTVVKGRVVERAAVHLPDQAQDVLRAVRIVLAEPFLEQRLDLVRQPKEHVARGPRSALGGPLEDRLELVIVESGDHGGGHDARRYAVRRQLAEHVQSLLRAGGPRLEAPLELVVERGHADIDRGKPVGGELLEQVEVAEHGAAFRHDRERMPELEQQL